MINIHDVAAANPDFFNAWKSANNQDITSLDWLPYFYEALIRMKTENGNASGDILYFPKGTYFMGATLHIVRGVHIVGEGIGNTILSIHKNTAPVFEEEGVVVPQDGIIFHFPEVDRLIGGNFKKFIPPFPPNIDEQTQKALIIDALPGQIDSSGFSAILEKLTINGNNEMRHGIVEHIPATVQDCEIRNFLGNGVHLFAHVHGRHDLALLYGKLPDGTISPPDPNHPDSLPMSVDPFTIQHNTPSTIDITAQFVAYMLSVLKSKNVPDENLPPENTLLALYISSQNTSSNPIVFSIDEARTQIGGVSVEESPVGTILLNYDGSNTEIGSKSIYIQFTGEFKYLDPHSGKAISIQYSEDIDYRIILRIFHEDYHYPFIRTNASTWKVFSSTIRDCQGHGLYTFNLDANAGMAQAVSCLNNQGFGFFDDSNLGNTYLGCYAAGNVEGNYWSGLHDSGVNVSYFIGCYSDNNSPSVFGKPAVVIGGNIRQDRVEGKKMSLYLKDSGTFDLMSMLRFMSYNGATLKDANKHTYMEFGRPGLRTVFSFMEYDVPTEDNGLTWQLALHHINHAQGYYDDGEWNIMTSSNQPQFQRMAFAGPTSQHHDGGNEPIEVEEGAIWFRNGYYLAAKDNYHEFIKVNAVLPNIDNPKEPNMDIVLGLYPSGDQTRKPQKGDILFNSNPTLGIEGQAAVYSGWICVEDYISNANREKWLPFGKIYDVIAPE